MIWCTLTVFIQKLSFSSFSPEPRPTCGLVLFSSCLPTARKTSPLRVLNSKPQHRLQIKMETAVLTFFFGALPVSVLHQHFMVQHFPHHFFFPVCEISADCYAKQFCVSVWLGRQLFGLMRSASTTVFLLIETHGGSRMFEARQRCVVRKCHAVSWKYTLGCSLRQDKWVLLGFGGGWSFSGEWS